MVDIDKHRIRGQAVKLDAVASLLVDVTLSPLGIGGAVIQVVVCVGVLQPVSRTRWPDSGARRWANSPHAVTR